MADLIGEPFTLHGLEVGPSLPDAQLAPGSQGLYVETLQGWLRLLAAATGDDAYSPGPELGTFGSLTEHAVNAVRRDAGLPEAGTVDKEVWKRLQDRLAATVLPPDPGLSRPAFPARGSSYDQLLREGLRGFGFELQDTETSAVLSLFKRLARDQKRGPATGRLTRGSFDHHAFWRKKWGSYEHTWGQFLGAPWLGVVIDVTDELWGTRPLFDYLYRLGRLYLEQAVDRSDLESRLAAPIHVRAIAGRLGTQDAEEIVYPGLEAILSCSSAAERAAAPKWFRAFEAAPARILVGDESILSLYQPSSTSPAGRPILVARSSVDAGTLYMIRATGDPDYHLDRIRDRVPYTIEDEWRFRHRANVYVGAYLADRWHSHLPLHSIAAVNGAVTRNSARALLVVRGVDVYTDEIRVIRTDGTDDTTPELNLADDTSIQLHWLQVSVFRLEIGALTAGATYKVTVPHSPTAPLPRQVTSWEFRTLPAAMPLGGISFVAASCYCDFGFPDATGALDHGARPGAVYSRALEAWKTNLPSFSPRFKALMGDNLYLDVGPKYKDWQGFTYDRLDADAETIGRYLRYWLCSDYRHVLATLPTFAIPDDHEYWNDYPRFQVRMTRSAGGRGGDFAAAARSSLRLFQGVMSPKGSTSEPHDASEFSYDWTIDGGGTCPLSFFFFDTTSTRQYQGITDGRVRLASRAIVDRLIEWARTLTGPGILILGQPLMIPRSYKALRGAITADYHPSAFAEFPEIMAALASAPWDILVVSGDVHWSRFLDCDPTLFGEQLARTDAEIDSEFGARYRPRLVELISSPAQRLAPVQILRTLSPLHDHHDKPDYDPPEQIRATAPWADKPSEDPRPRGPRVLGSSYVSPTFGAIHCQPISPSAMRVDLAFVDKAGRIAPRDPAPETAAPTGAPRWWLPGEWVRAGVQFSNELWRNYSPGTTTVEDRVRPYYPYGTYPEGEHGTLPPMTTSAQLVRWLVPGERLFVKRVLYQARRVMRGSTPEGAYQCLEVATMSPLEAPDHGSAVTASYFVWAIYNDKQFMAPCEEHLYSAILRKRLPWVEAEDRIEITGLTELWDKVEYPHSLDKERYEFGEIARAPFTPHVVRVPALGELATVKHVVYQAEQTLIGEAHKGAYQLLRVEMDSPGTSEPLSDEELTRRTQGYVWSVYDGRELVAVRGRHNRAQRDRVRRKYRLEEDLAWLRRGAGQFPNRLWAAERLAALLQDPEQLQVANHEATGVAIALWLWLVRTPERFVELVADVHAFDRQARDRLEYEKGKDPSLEIEKVLEILEQKLHIDDLEIDIAAETRNQPLDLMCSTLLDAALEKLSGDGGQKLARLLERLLGGEVDGPRAPVPLPAFHPTREVVIERMPETNDPDTADPIPFSYALLRSPIREPADDKVEFEYWPDPSGQLATAHLDKSTFLSRCRLIVWDDPHARNV